MTETKTPKRPRKPAQAKKPVRASRTRVGIPTMGSDVQEPTVATKRRSPRKPKAEASEDGKVVAITSKRSRHPRPTKTADGPGHTSALTPEITKAIIEAVGSGLDRGNAFRYADIGRATQSVWLRRGARERARIDAALLAGEIPEVIEGEQPFLALLDGLEHAEAVSLLRAASKIATITVDPTVPWQGQLRAAMFTMSHVHPQYVERALIDLTSRQDPIDLPVEKTVEEQMAFHREVIGVMVANGLVELPGDAPIEFDEE